MPQITCFCVLRNYQCEVYPWQFLWNVGRSHSLKMLGHRFGVRLSIDLLRSEAGRGVVLKLFAILDAGPAISLGEGVKSALSSGTLGCLPEPGELTQSFIKSSLSAFHLS